jgi:hypothetical protein
MNSNAEDIHHEQALVGFANSTSSKTLGGFANQRLSKRSKFSITDSVEHTPIRHSPSSDWVVPLSMQSRQCGDLVAARHPPWSCLWTSLALAYTKFVPTMEERSGTHVSRAGWGLAIHSSLMSLEESKVPGRSCCSSYTDTASNPSGAQTRL